MGILTIVLNILFIFKNDIKLINKSKYQKKLNEQIKTFKKFKLLTSPYFTKIHIISDFFLFNLNFAE
ncbi:hypothetical protein B0A70_15150 [Chryseobacterium piscicola]|uniref:Uncharacterized protein n=1 Tax=Chryseobacterium piscicola TaxID=551459 RepID=A0A2S7KBF9_9FLAO|nr:hypothetical protein B0A70_15150 [Chryseobacterium piscicola]